MEPECKASASCDGEAFSVSMPTPPTEASLGSSVMANRAGLPSHRGRHEEEARHAGRGDGSGPTARLREEAETERHAAERVEERRAPRHGVGPGEPCRRHEEEVEPEP